MKTEVFTAEIFKNCILAAEQRLLDNKEYLNFLDINFIFKQIVCQELLLVSKKTPSSKALAVGRG